MSAANASSVMATFGDSVSAKIIRKVNVVLDPVLGIVTQDSINVINTLAVFGRLPDSAVDGTRIFFSDKMLTISAATPVIESDVIEIDGAEFKVIQIDAPKAMGEILYYRVVCRG